MHGVTHPVLIVNSDAVLISKHPVRRSKRTHDRRFDGVDFIGSAMQEGNDETNDTRHNVKNEPELADQNTIELEREDLAEVQGTSLLARALPLMLPLSSMCNALLEHTHALPTA